MDRQKQKFAHETELGPEGIIEFLEELLAGFRSGELSLVNADNGVSLRPDGPVQVEIKAKASGARERLRLDLQWRPVHTRPALRIGPGAQPTTIGPDGRHRVTEPRHHNGSEGSERAREPASDELRINGDVLMSLPKDRLYAFARGLDLDNRSTLDKHALAHMLGGLDLSGLLSLEDLRTLARELELADEDDAQLDSASLEARLRTADGSVRSATSPETGAVSQFGIAP